MFGVAPRPGAAPSIPMASGFGERMRRVLLHEQRTGCADRAAVGGLERFVRSSAAGGDLAPADLAWAKAAIRLVAGYRDRGPEERQGIVARLLEGLVGGLDVPRNGSTVGSGAGSVPRPAPSITAVPPVQVARIRKPVAIEPISPGALVSELAGVGPKSAKAVSYTHLTLPTICSV